MKPAITVALWLFCWSAFAQDYVISSAKVIEGDVIQAEIEGTTLIFRFKGIACPCEDQPFAQKARELVGELCNASSVTLTVTKIDPQGFAWANVTLSSGKNLRTELLKRGYAWWNREQAVDELDLRSAEFDARQAKRGVWAIEDLSPPWQIKTTPKWAKPKKDGGFLDPKNWARRRKAQLQRVQEAATVLSAEEYVYTEYGECYHRRSCSTIQDSEEWYIADHQAINENSLRPCLVCNPR